MNLKNPSPAEIDDLLKRIDAFVDSSHNIPALTLLVDAAFTIEYLRKPRCDKCGAEITTGLMAVFCPRGKECEFWVPELETFCP